MKGLIVSTVCLMSVWGAEVPTHGELGLDAAVSRLLSYGIICEESDDESDDSVEILHHYKKYVNETPNGKFHPL